MSSSPAVSPTPNAKTVMELLGRGMQSSAIALSAPKRASMTYGELRGHVERTVATLNELGVGRNDRVALALPNGPEMASAFVAIAAGATTAPLNPAFKTKEFQFCLGGLNAKLLIVKPGTCAPAREAAKHLGIAVAELRSNTAGASGLFDLVGDKVSGGPQAGGYAHAHDIALVLQTSGTTSRPKTVPLTHANICSSAANVRNSLALVPEDRCLNIMPLFHIHGLVAALLSSLGAGASVFCTPGFSAEDFPAWMKDAKPTWYTAVPAMHQMILDLAARGPEGIGDVQLRLIRSSSASLPPQVMKALEDAFNVPVIEAYGMTEAAHQIASNPLPPRERKPGSVGLAAGPEVAVMDESGNLLPPGKVGEVVIRGPNVTAGYQNNPEANAAAFTQGWFRTGDQGVIDENGYLSLTGRLKEIINRGGEKIMPREIDEALMDHPAVKQAVAFAVPHPVLGEDVAAAVVLQDSVSTAAQELRRFLIERLAAFKVPSQVVIVDEIPKGPTGKVQRAGLAELLAPKLRPEYVAPRNPVEAALARIWTELLQVDRVGVHENFFELGGHSLLGTRVMSRIRQIYGKELPLLVLFEGPTIAEMAMRLQEIPEGAEVTGFPQLRRVTREGKLPLSLAQEGLWVLDQMEPGLSAFNVAIACGVTGNLDMEILRAALTEIVRRHEVLRTTFPSFHGQPVQVISTECHVALPIEDLRGLPKSEREAHARRLAANEARQPFNLATGPVLRFRVLHIDETGHILLITMHHIISDGWSRGLFMRELLTTYEAFSAHRPSPLPECPIQYVDYAVWERQNLRDSAMDAKLAYWKRRLAGPLPIIDLPTDHPRPPVQTFRGATQALKLSRATTESLKTLSRREGVTLFMSLLAAFQTLLHRYTGLDDIIVAVPIANRGRVELESLLGLFANTLALRTDFADRPSFRDLLRRVKEMMLGAYANQEVPFVKLVRELHLERDPSRPPLVQVMFAFQNYPELSLEIPGLQFTPEPIHTETARLDLTLSLYDNKAALEGEIEYNTDLFEADTIARMSLHFETLLEGIVANPDCRVRDLPLSP